MSFENNICKDKKGFEIVLENFIEYVENGNAQKLIHNFVNNFFIYNEEKQHTE